MNRRNFLKKVGAVCVGMVATLVVATNIKKEIKNQQVFLIDCDTWRKEREAKGITQREFLKKFRKAFRNTKFQPPLSPKYPYGLPPWMEIT